jgi:hypothetical protein
MDCSVGLRSDLELAAEGSGGDLLVTTFAILLRSIGLEALMPNAARCLMIPK